MSEIKNIKDLLAFITRRKRTSQNGRLKYKKDGNLEGYNYFDGSVKTFKEVEDLLKDLIKKIKIKKKEVKKIESVKNFG